MQGASCAVALNGLAYSGKVPAPVHFQELIEPPSFTAAHHAEQWCNNVRPVGQSLTAAGNEVQTECNGTDDGFLTMWALLL